MARKLIYKFPDHSGNRIEPAEWEEIFRLQHWYNSEFIWTSGKLALKMYAVFPLSPHPLYDEEELFKRIAERRTELRAEGKTEDHIVESLDRERLIIAKRGGYYDDCLASGFTHVAANEWNAYLVGDFLLKCSRIAPAASIELVDEGQFVKPGVVTLRNGHVFVPVVERHKTGYLEAMVEHRHVFSITDPAKYDRFPAYDSTVPGFNELDTDEQAQIVRDWRWLGFENDFDLNGDDVQGSNLNEKVDGFRLEK
jgi:hypothetical protein